MLRVPAARLRLVLQRVRRRQRAAAAAPGRRGDRAHGEPAPHRDGCHRHRRLRGAGQLRAVEHEHRRRAAGGRDPRRPPRSSATPSAGPPRPGSARGGPSARSGRCRPSSPGSPRSGGVGGSSSSGCSSSPSTVPLWARPSQEQAVALLLVYAIVAVSLLILTGWAGQISLGQFALVGFGGATTGILYERHGWDYLLALPVGMAVAALAAVVIGLPALRVRGPVPRRHHARVRRHHVDLLPQQPALPVVRPGDGSLPPVLWERIDLGEGWIQYEACLVGLLLAVARGPQPPGVTHRPRAPRGARQRGRRAPR